MDNRFSAAELAFRDEVRAFLAADYPEDLRNKVRDELPLWTVQSTAARGIAPDQVEAIAFASFARRTVRGLPGNLPSVTGASRPCVLGAVYAV